MMTDVATSIQYPHHMIYTVRMHTSACVVFIFFLHRLVFHVSCTKFFLFFRRCLWRRAPQLSLIFTRIIHVVAKALLAKSVVPGTL